MKNTLLFILILFSVQLSVYGQSGRTYKSTIVFRSDVLTSVMVNDPIDNAYNNDFTTNIYKLAPQKPITHIVKINGFSTIKVKYTNGLQTYLLVLENEHIEVCLTNKKIIIKGDNAVGNQYLLDNYSSKGLGNFNNVFDVIKKYKSPVIDMQKIDKEIKDSVLSIYRNDIHKMLLKKQITYRFAYLMDKSLENGYTVIEFYNFLNFFRKNAEKKLTTADSLTIMERFNQKYKESLAVMNPKGYYYQYPFIGYYEFKYAKMNENLKKQLSGKYDNDIFGSFAFLWLAPDSLQQVILGQIIVSTIQSRDDYFNYYNIQTYFNEKFPNSEYVPIIKDLLKKQSEKINEKVDSSKYIFIDDKSISTVAELVGTNSLKGKRIFIDLWSVTCIPCKVQFQYVEQLHKLLEKYENVVPLYITIDEANEESRWRTDITYFHLLGYHLMANKALYKDISKVFYGGQSCYIPRYILLDENGKVLNANLPRPEKIDNLEIVLDSLLKK